MGPFRLNLSKSGVGVSTGVKGLSISRGTRGSYLSAGMKGLYYRTRLNPKKLKSKAVLRYSSLWIVVILGIVLAGLFGIAVLASIAALLTSP
jgi:hypothetical protein